MSTTAAPATVAELMRFEIDAIDMVTASGGLVAAKHTYLDWQSALAQLGLA